MQLNENEIHLWIIDTNTVLNYQHYVEFLSQHEQTKASKLIFETVRKSYTVTHFAAREILSRYLNISPKNIPITYTQYNKPYLIQTSNHIEFNLSHSYAISLLAITKKALIGIDIEKMRLLQDQKEIEKLVFTNKECQWLNAQAEEERMINFFRFWTAKEAMMKGIGEGFHFGAKNIEFQPQADYQMALTLPTQPNDAINWHVHNFIAVDNYMSALATKQPIRSLSHFNWEG